MAEVVIWRELLMPFSETFIVGQMAALQRWTPRLAGVERYAHSLPVAPDFVLSSGSPVGRVRARVFRKTGLDPLLLRELRRPQVKLVHAHFLHDGGLIYPATHLARVPLVVTAHGFDVTMAAHRERIAHSPMLTGAAAFVAVSDFIAGELTSLGVPERKVHVLPIGIEVPADVSPDGARAGIVFVGRLVEKKGCADLLQAVAALPGELRTTPVTIIGDGALRGELEREAERLGVAARFLGARTPAQIREELAGSAVFCGPSKRAPDGDAEGFGMVFLEAAAARVPAVSYRSGGVAAAIEDGVTGLLCDEGDVEGLTASLSQLLSDAALRRRMGDAGRQRVERDFDIARRTAALEDLYDGVARPA